MRLSFLACLLLVAGCATPIAPSGGPADTTPPRLVESSPVDGAVNVRAEELVLTFSENVDEGSVVRAFDIAPGWEAAPEVRVRGRRVEVAFPDSLRANTTYVVSFDTNLKDLRNVALPQPITLAFATGPVLDRGQIAGRVSDPQSGAPVSGLDVFAYALADTSAADSMARPDPRTAAPDYRTQTGQAGTFTLDYLRPESFFVVAVADANRNRRADPGEAFAVPYTPVVRAVTPDSAHAAPALRAFRVRLDTIPPEPLRIRTRSDARFAVRFDEPIALRDRSPDAWSLTDTTTGEAAPVRQVYADDDPQQIVLRTDALPATPHQLFLGRPAAIADSAGNVALTDPLVFTPSADPDTLEVRFLNFLPASNGAAQSLAPRDTAGVRFNAPPDSAVLARIAVSDTLGTALPFTLWSRDGVRYRITPTPNVPFQITVPQPDSIYTRRFTPLPLSERGELAGVVVAADSGQIVVEARIGEARYAAEADATGAFRLTDLPEGEARLRVFVDRNGNGHWDGGRLSPLVLPEPLRFVDAPQTVRPRWESVIDTLTID